uniref:Uncharacterized protein n=1 Tax=Anguilla anguilla TaxID=7936 RepID=A0A0E9QQA6_ANGAN
MHSCYCDFVAYISISSLSRPAAAQRCCSVELK